MIFLDFLSKLSHVFFKLPCYFISQMCFSQYSAFRVPDDTAATCPDNLKEEEIMMKEKLVGLRNHSTILLLLVSRFSSNFSGGNEEDDKKEPPCLFL